MNLESIKQLIRENQLRQAIISLEAYLRGDEKSIGILLNRRFSEIREQTQQGVISTSEASLEFNKIANNLLEFINDLEHNRIVDNTYQDNFNNLVSEQEYESNLWTKTALERSIESYYSYLEKSKLKLYTSEAVFAIEDIREIRAWRETAEVQTIDSFEKFLKAFPNGHLSHMARSSLNRLEDRLLWEKALNENTQDSFQNYLHQSNLRFFEMEAKMKISKFLEDQAWRIAKNKNTFSSYREYLGKYPRGRYLWDPYKIDSAVEPMSPTYLQKYTELWTSIFLDKMFKVDFVYRPFFIVLGSVSFSLSSFVLIFNFSDSLSANASETSSIFQMISFCILIVGMYLLSYGKNSLFYNSNRGVYDRNALVGALESHIPKSRRFVFFFTLTIIFILFGPLLFVISFSSVESKTIPLSDLSPQIVYLVLSFLWIYFRIREE